MGKEIKLWDCLKCSNNWKNCKCIYFCRFHPTNWYHEIGCSHVKWSDEEKISVMEDRELKEGRKGNKN